ncbi:uncharacterized protein TNCV_30151 [Trichonephila clavipes]|nr:uncharacterized protein TNCV_30151 [Trichonephila clavipes]
MYTDAPDTQLGVAGRGAHTSPLGESDGRDSISSSAIRVQAPEGNSDGTEDYDYLFTDLSNNDGEEREFDDVPADITEEEYSELGLGSNPGESIKVCKCIVPSRHGGTLNSRRAASPLMKLVEGEERWEAPDDPHGVLPQIWDGTEQNRTVTYMVIKGKANDKRKNLALRYDKFGGP